MSYSKLIGSSISEAYAFANWQYANEAEFKHELFHCLARKTVGGTCLSDSADGQISPRLHAETKIENGNPKKADLIICEPSEPTSGGFNYRVLHVLELKQRLTGRAIRGEIEKIDTYRGNYDGIWLISAEPARLATSDIPKSHPATPNFYVRLPDHTQQIVSEEGASISLNDAVIGVHQCIDECLALYIANKRQFQSFYWCNYEHELERGHSYPCEGDFNAQLYHRLRMYFPKGVEIRSEYSPISLPQRRVDLVVRATNDAWAIPIEVKMNWDQFKPKYKQKVLQRSEANTILDRFTAMSDEVATAVPILVVIQGEWRRPTKMPIRENALADLVNSPIPLAFVSVNETVDSIEWKSFG